MLNMANAYNPGGGVLGGASAQEEDLFRRTTLTWSLYQFADYHDQYVVRASPEGKAYPIPPDVGAIYSRNVVAFRSSEATGYALLRQPYEVAVITVAAIDSPACVTENGEERLAPMSVRHTLPRLRAILRHWRGRQRTQEAATVALRAQPWIAQYDVGVQQRRFRRA